MENRFVSGILSTMVLVLMSWSSCLAADTRSGLIGYWRFDYAGQPTSFPDSSGNGLTAMVTSNNGFEYEGVGNAKYGTAIEPLNGTFLKVAHKAVIDSFAHGLTISVWVMRNANTGNNVLVSRQKGTTTAQCFLFTINNNKLEFDIDPLGTGKTTLISTQDVPDREVKGHAVTYYYHVAVTYDNSTIKLYFDGVMIKSLAYSTPIGNLTETNPLLLYGVSTNGGTSAISGTGYNGRTDEMRIYNRALSATEIQGIFTWDGTSPPTQVLLGEKALKPAAAPAASYSLARLSTGRDCTVGAIFSMRGQFMGSSLQTFSKGIYIEEK